MIPACTSVEYKDRPVSINLQAQTGNGADRASLPHWPTSSLTLAMSAILVLIPLPCDNNIFNTSRIYLRRVYAQLFAEAALEKVDCEIHGGPPKHTHSSALEGDAMDQSTLFPILALVLLSLYEYCQRGSISRMRSRANQAITVAMDHRLHDLGALATEAQRRAWWGAVS